VGGGGKRGGGWGGGGGVGERKGERKREEYGLATISRLLKIIGLF